MFKKNKTKNLFSQDQLYKNPKEKLPFAVIIWLQDGPQ